MNIQSFWARILIASSVIIVSLTLQAEESAKQLAQSEKSVSSQSNHNSIRKLLKYVPPAGTHKGSPSNLLVATLGATRNAGDLKKTLPVLTLLSLNNGIPAFTLSAQPVLYWHLSQNSSQPTLFTLTELDADEPLLEIRINQASTAGFHRLSLQDYDITLQTGKIYEWSISLVTDVIDGIHSMNDTMEKAFIKRVTDNELSEELADSADRAMQLRIYADNDLWYDSLHLLFGDAPNQAENNALRLEREQFLKLSGL